MNDDGYKELALAVVQTAVNDCKASIRALNKHEEKLEKMSFELGG